MKKIAFLLLVIIAISCQSKQENKKSNEISSDKQMNITKEHFGTTEDGKEVSLYALKNTNDVVVKIMNYGGIIVSIIVPDKDGNMGDVVLGFDDFKEYEKRTTYFGSLIGRYGNRIKDGKITLEGQEYTFVKNNGLNHLHGGLKGFDKQVWEATEIKNKDGVGLELFYLSADGEEGYPGNLTVKVTYTLTDNNELKINYEATTDKTTVLNLTNHSFFNLKDAGKSDILSHELKIIADSYTPTDANLIPTGEIAPVEGTPMDFREFHTIGERIDTDFEALNFAGGYDHNYVLDAEDKGEMKLVAEVIEPETGRTMKTYTVEPGVQFYAGNFLDGSFSGKGGAVIEKRNGFCLETQHFPDSPNNPQFPSTELKPGETYSSSTIYEFGVQK